MADSNRIITLLTDFGNADVYVGVMKGVMLGINTNLTLVDLTHHIPAFNVQAAAFQLQNAYAHFPPSTVHLVVVDPGVGSQRKALALETAEGFFVGPDNGVFSSILSSVNPAHEFPRAVTLDNPKYWYRSTSSNTFQGRDIFAPVAAHLASGMSLAAIGTPILLDNLIQLDPLPCKQTTTGLCGLIQAIDCYGNGISTIPAHRCVSFNWRATAKGKVFPGHQTYSSVPQGAPLSLPGSHGWIEVSVNAGSAQQWAALAVGDPIELTWVALPEDPLL
jgi:S-adenosyl-L-methionine hydrolase (adenosine-forming)